MGVPYTPEQLQKLKLIWDEGKRCYVRISEGTPVHLVKKIEPPLVEQMGTAAQQLFESQQRIKKLMSSKPISDLSMAHGMAILAKKKLGLITLPNGEVIKSLFTFNLAPCPAPRMTRSDKWKIDPNHPDPLKRQRKPVTRYFAWKNAFIAMCNESGYTLQETLRVLFIMPLPKYLSRKKREMKLGQPHKQRPDTDNMIKAIKDSFKADDGFVWDERGVKLWGNEGKIIIF